MNKMIWIQAAAAVVPLATACLTSARADTIDAALVRGYQNNPQLNARRAQVRSTDENVAKALSSYGPKVSATASVGYQYTDTQTVVGGAPGSIIRSDNHSAKAPRSANLTVTQTLFDGDQTASRTRAAEAQVSGARQALRVLEQTVLLKAATTYMDYLRDAAVLEVQKSNVHVLDLQQTGDHVKIGDVTRTDVAQSVAQLAAGRRQELTAQSNLTTTASDFRRIIGNDPHNLAAASPVDRFLAPNLQKSVDIRLLENPNVPAVMDGIEVKYLQVKINEGAPLPTVSLHGWVKQSYEQTLGVYQSLGASAIGQVSMPLYQGEYALIRRCKENLPQQHLNLDTTRDQTRASRADHARRAECAAVCVECQGRPRDRTA